MNETKQTRVYEMKRQPYVLVTFCSTVGRIHSQIQK